MELIDWCRKGISLPQFSECFRERTETGGKPLPKWKQNCAR